ncbi:MAG: metal-dependent hydrolase [Pseudomonadota bacterium]
MTAIPTISSTPEGVSIEPRNRRFELEAALGSDWFDNDPFHTAIFNAFSISFPSGEKEFMDTVRHFEGQIKDEKLLTEVRGFYQQEGIHTREHLRYNRMLCKARGYNLEHLERPFTQLMERMRSDPRATPEVRLAATVGLEHFTAGFAEVLLKTSYLDKADPKLRELWQWHSLEEMEHKAVAFDVFQAVCGDTKMRKRVLRIAFLMLVRRIVTVTMRMLAHDKQLWKWKTLKSAATFFFSKTGFVRQYLPHHREFFKDAFHPWNTDTRDLMETWKPRLEAA